MQDTYFRAGAGAVIANEDGLILALERTDVAGAWQLPQGGLHAEEDPLTAALREAAEETGIPAAKLRLLSRYPEPLAYELPPTLRTAKTGRGQAQYWFLFRLLGTEADVQLPDTGEFRRWRWQSLEQLVHDTVAFRKHVYQRLASAFAPHLKSHSG